MSAGLVLPLEFFYAISPFHKKHRRHPRKTVVRDRKDDTGLGRINSAMCSFDHAAAAQASFQDLNDLSGL